MVIIVGKRFYVVLFSALCISLLLLGFSFSKESGSNDIADMVEIKNNDYRIVYSNNHRLDTSSNNKVDISVINKSDKKLTFYLYLSEVNEKKYTDVYYSLNENDEVLLSDGVINLGELNSFGENGDYSNYSIEIYSKSDNNLEFHLEVKGTDPNLLSNKVIASDSVYQDTNGSFRYYGEKNVNNYIKYNDDIFRIVGFVNGRIMIISEATTLSNYSPSNNDYLTLDNYIKSFSSDSGITVTDILDQKSWLINDKEYWLLDDEYDNAICTSLDMGVETVSKMSNYYVRNVYEIDDVLVNSGDGSLAHPYEVSYGS